MTINVPTRKAIPQRISLVLPVIQEYICLVLVRIIFILSILFYATISVKAEVPKSNFYGTYVMEKFDTQTFAEDMALFRAEREALEWAKMEIEKVESVGETKFSPLMAQLLTHASMGVKISAKDYFVQKNKINIKMKIDVSLRLDLFTEQEKQVKGKENLSRYEELEDDLARLFREREVWTQMVSGTLSGKDDQKALERINDLSNAISVGMARERNLLTLLSATDNKKEIRGKALFSNALEQLNKKQDEKEVLDELIEKILDYGFLIEAENPDIKVKLSAPTEADVSVTLSIKVSELIKQEFDNAVYSTGGLSIERRVDREGGAWARLMVSTMKLTQDPELANMFQQRIANLKLLLGFHLGGDEILYCSMESQGLENLAPIKSIKFSKFGTLFGIVAVLREPDLGMGVEDGYIGYIDETLEIRVSATLPLSTVNQIQAFSGVFLEDPSQNLIRQTITPEYDCSVESFQVLSQIEDSNEREEVGSTDGLPTDHVPPNEMLGLSKTLPPEYPLEARKNGWEGSVLVRILVLEDGRPDEIVVKQSSGHKILDAAAVEAVKKWIFYPAKNAGHPIRSVVEIPINFDLN